MLNTGSQEQMEKIGGWLWFIVFVLVLQPFLFLKLLVQISEYGMQHVAINYAILCYDLIASVLSIHVLYLLFKKRDIVPSYFIFHRLLLFPFWAFIFFWGTQLNITTNASAALIKPMFALIISILVMIPYFIKSKRVKATFIQPLDNTKGIEAFLLPFIPIFMKISGSLTKKPALMFPKLIGFIVVTFGLCLTLAALI